MKDRDERLGAERAATGNLPPPVRMEGWGRHPKVAGHELRSEDLESITRAAVLTRGMGRSYGDASLPPPGAPRVVANSTLADRILSFDAETGIVRAEAGLCLRSLHHVCVPRGWFAVTPGTQLITIGGMVASDVHGKGHHVDGTFGEHVLSLRLRVADGRILEISDDCERELFRATIGGMGLTGHILEVEFRLRPIPSPWIFQESERLDDIDAVVDHLKKASEKWPFTVCWVDCFSTGKALGRGIVMSGRWAEPDEVVGRKWKEIGSLVSIPFDPPEFLPRTLGVKLFNAFYFWLHGAAAKHTIVHPYMFFYPLDVVNNWNRLYGKRGFTQYQCVLPVRAGNPVLRRMLHLFQQRKTVPYVNVVKDCGAEGKGMLSFPKPGISFALDFPVTDRLQSVIDEVNEMVIAEGGRIYLTKDAFTREKYFRAMDPRVEEFNRVRRRWDPEGRLKSAQSVRVLGDTP